MSEPRAISGRITDDAGGSLPAVLIAVGVGAMLLSPFLAHVSSRMLATRVAEANAAEHYAADSGVEFGIWHLDNDSAYRAAVNAGSDSPLTIDVNGVPVSVDSTALPIGAWTEMADTLDSVGAGGSLVMGGDGRVYTLRGSATIQAWRYDPSSDTWSDFAVSDAPAGVDAGGSFVRTSGDQFYALQGGGSPELWGYESDGNSWDTSLSELPGGAGDGASLAYHSGESSLYALRGSNTASFLRYRLSGSPPAWAAAPDAPGDVDSGGSLVAANGYLYAFQGGGSSSFWRFDPKTGPDGRWSTGGQDPADPPAAVGSGASLTWDGGDFIYAYRGGQSDEFWRYQLSRDSWEILAATPERVGQGGALTYGGDDTIYGLQGNQGLGLWKFEVTPPRYDVEAVAGDTTHSARIELDGPTISIIFWDVQ